MVNTSSMDSLKGTGKTNTRQYNSEFKNRSYFMVTLTNAVREFFNKIFFQISAVRTGVRAYMDATPLLLLKHLP